MIGEIGESSVYADNLFPKGNGRTVRNEPIKNNRKVGESSVHVNDSSVCIDHIVLSRARTRLRKSARVPSIQMTVLHSALAAQYTAERQATSYDFLMYQPMHLLT